MKKLKAILSVSLSLILLLTIPGCTSKKSSSLRTVRLNEVVRSVFYAPMYAAIANGYFKEEGLDIELSTGQGAEATISKTQVTFYSLSF